MKTIEMVREADIDWHKHWNDDGTNHLERLVELARADERDACAEIDFYELLRSVCSKEQAEEYADLISTAIKARSNK